MRSERELRNYLREMQSRAVVIGAALSVLALAACYHGPNLRDCSQWSTTSIAGCFDGG
jgi:hypothetical protein